MGLTERIHCVRRISNHQTQAAVERNSCTIPAMLKSYHRSNAGGWTPIFQEFNADLYSMKEEEGGGGEKRLQSRD